jgi:hypothetical protein
VKLLIDANPSPRIARALNHLVEPEGHQVHALVDRFAPAIPDTEWLSALATDTGWAALTFDRQIMKRPREREAWFRSGVVVFALVPAWSKGFGPREQSARLLLVWPKLVAAFDAVDPPAGFMVPISLRGRPSQLRTE